MNARMEWSTGPPNKLNVARGSQDSAINSHESSLPFQDSQGLEFSQVATQDMFSQNITPQREANKQTSMYDKWKSRQSVFKQDTSSPHTMAINQAGCVPGSSKKMPHSGLRRWDSKQSISSLCTPIRSDVKALDCDERKLLDQIVNTVKYCNSEVKSTLLYLMEHLEKIADVSSGQLAKSFSSFLENIWIHEESLKKLIQDQGASKSDQSGLEMKISEKDGQIATLKKQLTDTKEDEAQRYSNTLKIELQEFQATLVKHIESLHSLGTENQKHQSEVITDISNNIHAHQKQNESLCKTVKTCVKDSEKGIVADISKVLQKQTSLQRDNQKEMRKLLEDQTSHILQNLTSHGLSRQALDKQTTSLEKAMQFQFKSMFQSLEETIKRELKSIEKQISVERRAQGKSVGTATDNSPLESLCYEGKQYGYESFGEIESMRNKFPSTTKDRDRCIQYPSKDGYSRTISVQEMQCMPKQPNEHTFNDASHATRSSEKPKHLNFMQGIMSRDEGVNRSGQDFTKTMYNDILHINDYSGRRRGIQQLLPVSRAPFVSPFPKQGNAFTPRKGPSPCAVVAPQRKTPNVPPPAVQSAVKSWTPARLEQPPVSQNPIKPKKGRRKCVYSVKKKSSKKKCIIEGLSKDSDKPEKNSKNQKSPREIMKNPQLKQSESMSQWLTRQAPSSREVNVRNYDNPTGGIANSAGVARKTFDPYVYDEPDHQDISTRQIMRRPEQFKIPMPKTLSPKRSSATLGMRHSGTFTSAGVNNKSPAKRPSIVSSPDSSPSVSVACLRKFRTPFHAYNINRQWRAQGPPSSRVQRMNGLSGSMQSPSNTFLSDI